MNNLPTYATQSKTAREFAINDVVRFPKPHGTHEGTRSYWRYRIVEALGPGRYGLQFEVEDIETGERKTQGFGNWVNYIVEGKGE